jgi:hypothetical protein
MTIPASGGCDTHGTAQTSNELSGVISGSAVQVASDMPAAGGLPASASARLPP